MSRLARACLVVVLAMGIVACQETRDDQTANRAIERLASAVEALQTTSQTLLQQLNAVPDIRFTRGLVGAVGNSYGSFLAVSKGIDIPREVLPDYRILQGQAGAVQTLGGRAGATTDENQFVFLVESLKQKMLAVDISAKVVLLKLEKIRDD